ncbi:MAG: hypothetical protein QXD03_00290 [Candidatus Anstonellales archaeon]
MDVFKLEDLKVQLLWIGIFLVLYLITKNVIFGFGIFFVIVYGAYLDIKKSSKDKGGMNTIKELFITILGVIVLTQVIGLLIGTAPSPEPVLIFPSNTFRPILSVIPSCSMEPNYRQGDILIIGDASNINSIRLEGKFNPSPIMIYGNYTYNLGRSIWLYCEAKGDGSICKEFYEHPERFVEIYGDLKIFYDKCTRTGNIQEICVSGFEVNGERYKVSPKNGDPVVYAPNPKDIFYRFGFIIHRVQFILCDGNDCLYFTKGDNNNIFDFQFGNYPFNSSRIIGKPIVRIPYLGYIRIFLGGVPLDTKECQHVLTCQ